MFLLLRRSARYFSAVLFSVSCVSVCVCLSVCQQDGGPIRPTSVMAKLSVLV